MLEKIMQLAISNGLWAVLFLMLLIYVLKDTRQRETKYQQTIASLSESLSVVQNIKEDIEDIKECIAMRTKKTKVEVKDEEV